MLVLEVVVIDLIEVLLWVLLSGAVLCGSALVLAFIKAAKEDFDEYCQQCDLEDLDGKKSEQNEPVHFVGTCKHCGAPLSDNVCSYCNCIN